MKIVAGILCAGLCCLQATAGASDTNFPSEDEIYEAWVTGEIDFDQYQLLMEAVQYGIDPSLFDLADLSTDSLDTEEESGGKPPKPRKRRESQAVTARYQFYQVMDEPERSRYAALLKGKPSAHWQFLVRTRKETSGRERFVGRTLSYSDDSGLVREVTLGSFSRKFGLGSAVSYRGKLFDRPDELNWESFLCPDYGGFNGGSVRLQSGTIEMTMLTSYNRNDEYSLQTEAACVATTKGRVRPSVTLATTALRNRSSDETLHDHKAAVTMQLHSSGSDITLEYCAQTGAKEAYGTLLADARIRTEFGRVAISGWRYDHSYLALASGGRSAAISHSLELAEIDLSISDRRAGQTGIQIGVESKLAKAVRWSSKAMAAWLNADSSVQQLRSEIAWQAGSRWEAGIQYYLGRTERGVKDSLFHRIRGSLRYASEQLNVKTVVGQSATESGNGAFSWLTDLRFRPSPATELQFWSNLARYMNGRIDYWYLFAKVKQQIGATVTIATKVTERYSADASDHYQRTFGLEVSAAL
ncbi:MAG: hypothetical protein IPH75_00780 [bacterium]|nr:hypothetical protein [bacterium]